MVAFNIIGDNFGHCIPEQREIAFVAFRTPKLNSVLFLSIRHKRSNVGVNDYFAGSFDFVAPKLNCQ